MVRRKREGQTKISAGEAKGTGTGSPFRSGGAPNEYVAALALVS